MKAGNGKWGQSTESGGKVEGRREEGGKEERGLVQEVNKKKNVGGGGGGGAQGYQWQYRHIPAWSSFPAPPLLWPSSQHCVMDRD